MFFSTLYYLIGTGVRPYHTDREKRRIEAINLFNILCASIGSLYGIFFFYENDNLRSLPVLFFATVSFSSISVLQYKQKHSSAIILLNINCGLAATMMSFLHGWWSGFPLCFLVTPLMIAVFQDFKQSWTTFWVGLYYFTMILFTYALHYYGYESKTTDAEVIFPINFVVVLVLILALSFYLWRIYDDYSLQVARTNEELSNKNEELLEKNQNIESLVGMLHDKVKNNLQTLYLFAEMDRMARLDVSIDFYMRLSRSRIKVIDICYQLEYEYELPANKWLKRFLKQYAAYLQNHYNDCILPDTNYTSSLKDTHLLLVSRKRFETMMLLLNETCNFVVQQADTKIGGMMHMESSKPNPEENSFVISFSIKEYPKKPVFNPFFLRFVKEQHVKLGINYDENTHFLKIDMDFKTEK